MTSETGWDIWRWKFDEYLSWLCERLKWHAKHEKDKGIFTVGLQIIQIFDKELL